MSSVIAQTLIEKTKNFTIEEALAFLVSEYKNKVVFSTSFGQEDQVITAIIAKNDLKINIFTLDTGRLFQETYDVFHKTIKKYKNEIKTYFPETVAVEDLLNKKGPNSFYESVETMQKLGATRFIEVGPGRVLSGFIKKIDKNAEIANVENLASFEALINQ